MIDLEFRKGLKLLLEKDSDKDIVSYVLEHAVSQYPTSFMFWMLRKQRDYDNL